MDLLEPLRRKTVRRREFEVLPQLFTPGIVLLDITTIAGYSMVKDTARQAPITNVVAVPAPIHPSEYVNIYGPVSYRTRLERLRWLTVMLTILRLHQNWNYLRVIGYRTWR